MEFPDPPDTGPTDLTPCGICGRTFRPDALIRHTKACEKNATKKRKVFDSSKQRAVEDGTNGGESRPKATKPPPSKAKAVQNKAKSKTRSNGGKISKTEPALQKSEEKAKPNWREKHEELIDTIKRARGKDDNQNDAGSELKKKVPSGYVQCPACQRHFNQRAAERHVPWCQKKKAETPKSPAEVAEAKEKLIARVKYRPPQGKSRVQPPQRKWTPPEKKSTPPPPQRDKGPRSSPPNLLDNRAARTNSLDRINDNVKTQPIYRRRSGSRSREKEPVPSPELPLHIIKFKERFPHHTSKRNVDFEESFSSEQLRELLSCNPVSRCPKTVPGVRLSNSGGQNNDNWNNNWNKRSNGLPEVSSSEGLPGAWAGRPCWDLDQSVGSTGSSGGSSSGSSLPPLSRERGGELPPTHCHQCSSRFPLVAAKYCCECGARRRVAHTG